MNNGFLNKIAKSKKYTKIIKIYLLISLLVLFFIFIFVKILHLMEK